MQFRNQILLQSTVWLGIFALASMLGTPFGKPEGFYFLMFLRLLMMAALFNFVRFVLLDFYLKNQKSLFFGLCLLCLAFFAGASAWLEHAFGFTKLIAATIPLEWQQRSSLQKAFPSFTIVPSLMIGLVIIGAAVSSGIFSAFQKKKKDEENANRRRLEAENALLKSQINPHFLLNSLNNLYALALTQPEKTPDALLKLSEMVAYILHECASLRVPLERDLNFVENYLALQKLRLPPNVALDVEMPNASPGLEIEPMILITFIENAFKHGLTTRQPSEIFISIKMEKNWLLLRVENPILPPKNDKNGNASGIGIANTQSRLEHSYPGKHFLKIENDGAAHRIELKIDLVK